MVYIRLLPIKHSHHQVQGLKIFFGLKTITWWFHQKPFTKLSLSYVGLSSLGIKTMSCFKLLRLMLGNFILVIPKIFSASLSLTWSCIHNHNFQLLIILFIWRKLELKFSIPFCWCCFLCNFCLFVFSWVGNSYLKLTIQLFYHVIQISYFHKWIW